MKHDLKSRIERFYKRLTDKLEDFGDHDWVRQDTQMLVRVDHMMTLIKAVEFSRSIMKWNLKLIDPKQSELHDRWYKNSEKVIKALDKNESSMTQDVPKGYASKPLWIKKDERCKR